MRYHVALLDARRIEQWLVSYRTLREASDLFDAVADADHGGMRTVVLRRGLLVLKTRQS
jgi:hypothetical protein